MATRSHLSIGEVLSLLREEFPDVTISKIRFLESQGLVDPERTPSGYRKFYDHDVERLRWILRQQRDQFLPLKVIKGRLFEDEDVTGGTPSPTNGAGGTEAPVDAAVATNAGGSSAAAPSPAAPPSGDQSAAGPSPSSEREDVRTAVDPLQPDPGAPIATAPEEKTSVPLAAAAESAPAGEQPDEPVLSEASAAPDPAEGSDAAPPAGVGSTSEGTDRPQRDTYTAEELAEAAGATAALIEELAQFGLLTPQGRMAGSAYYGPDSLAVARAASRFSDFGVEPRHLRAWRNSADREAGLYEQLVVPLVRQRNPQARQQAVDRLTELDELGGQLRSALMRQALKQIRL